MMSEEIMEDIEGKIFLRCSVCGNDQFSVVDERIEFEDLLDAPDETEVKCSDCGKVTTKGQLIEDNQDLINANNEDIKEDALKMIEKEFRKMFK